VEIETTDGPMLSVPYTVETNDITMMALQQHTSDEMFKRSKDQFDRLYQESENSARVMSISLHMYLTGAAHRIKYFEDILDYIMGHSDVAIVPGEDIMDWYRAAHA
jgi:hypothetical protein